jgi:glycosyltransferase involved in cell wall biosynthesis
MSYSTQPLLVVVPALNEEESIGRVIQQLLQMRFRVLVVDDGSSDSTASVAMAAGADVLKLPIQLGVGGALQVGFRFAVSSGYKSVVQIDADDQHPIHMISALEAVALERRAHLVIGSRHLSSETTLVLTRARRIGTIVLKWLTKRATGQDITDPTSGFRIICEPLLSAFAQDFPVNYLGDTFEATIYAARAGYTIEEVPAPMRPRALGKSTIGELHGSLLLLRSLIVIIFRLRKLRLPPVKADAGG